MPQSEIARIRQQIELECQALQLLKNEPATVASHRIINHRYDILQTYIDDLAAIVGVDQAAITTVETYKKVLG